MPINNSKFSGSGVKVTADNLGNKLIAENDLSLRVYDGSTGGPNYATLGTAKSTVLTDLNGAKVYLPVRSLSMTSSELIPGWTLDFNTAWATGTVPVDMNRNGTFGGAWYSTVSGTPAEMTRYRSFEGGNNAMAFFSGQFKITALPEAGRFLHFGQFAAGPHGFGIRIESTGAATLRIVDTYGGVNLVLDSGMTVAVNDSIVVERFGYRLTAMKTATTGRELLSADAAATSRPLNARLGQGTTDSFYARVLAGSSFGLSTDSTAVRISEVGFCG